MASLTKSKTISIGTNSPASIILVNWAPRGDPDLNNQFLNQLKTIKHLLDLSTQQISRGQVSQPVFCNDLLTLCALSTSRTPYKHVPLNKPNSPKKPTNNEKDWQISLLQWSQIQFLALDNGRLNRRDSFGQRVIKSKLQNCFLKTNHFCVVWIERVGKDELANSKTQKAAGMKWAAKRQTSLNLKWGEKETRQSSGFFEISIALNSKKTCKA